MVGFGFLYFIMKEYDMTTATYVRGDISLTLPRRLSDNEQRMMNKSVDVINGMHHGHAVRQYVALSALSTILCAEPLWPQMARVAMLSVNSAASKSAKASALLRMEGIIVGMVHVFEIRYNIHDGYAIAQSIDDATRQPGFDALSGIISTQRAWRVITAMYGDTPKDGQSNTV